MLPLPQQPRRRHTARRTARLLQYSPPQRQRDRRYFFLLRLWRFPPSCGVTLLFRGCAVRRSLRVLSAICGRPTISGGRTLVVTLLCAVVVCRVTLRSRRDGETAVRRSGADAAEETIDCLPLSADAGDTAGAVGACVLIAGDGGCTVVCGAGCTAVRGCRLSRCRCHSLRLRHDRRHTERTNISTWYLPCLLRCLLYMRHKRHGAARRRYGRTGRNSGAVLLGWTADAVCPCAAVAAATAAAGADAGRMTGRFCRRYRWTFRHSLLRISCANLGKIAFAVQKRLHRRRGYGTHWCYARWTRCGRLPRRRRGGRFGNGLLRCAGGFCVAWKYLFRLCAAWQRQAVPV